MKLDDLKHLPQTEEHIGLLSEAVEIAEFHQAGFPWKKVAYIAGILLERDGPSLCYHSVVLTENRFAEGSRGVTPIDTLDHYEVLKKL